MVAMLVSGLVAVHALCGLGGLLVLPVPLVAPYGSPVHRFVGMGFVGAMTGAGASGLLLSMGWMLLPQYLHPDASPGQLRLYGAFLGYLGILLLSSVWGGVAAWRVRGVDRVAQGFAAVLAAGGLALTGVGLVQGSWLFLAYGVLGAAAGISALLRKTPLDRRERHARAMFGAAIAASTAFLALGLRRWVEIPEVWAPLVWLGPTLAGVPLLSLLLRRDRAARTMAR